MLWIENATFQLSHMTKKHIGFENNFKRCFTSRIFSKLFRVFGLVVFPDLNTPETDLKLTEAMAEHLLNQATGIEMISDQEWKRVRVTNLKLSILS